jgi:hypothetical protein
MSINYQWDPEVPESQNRSGGLLGIYHLESYQMVVILALECYYYLCQIQIK